MATVSNSIDTRNSLQSPPHEKRLHAILIGRYFFPIRGAHVFYETFFEHVRGRMVGAVYVCMVSEGRFEDGEFFFVSRVATFVPDLLQCLSIFENENIRGFCVVVSGTCAVIYL